MPVNPAEINFFAHLAQKQSNIPIVPLSKKTIAEFRAGTVFFKEYVGDPADVSSKNSFIITRDAFHLPIRIYNSHLNADSPVLIFYPGNGYAVDLFEINAIAASRIAESAKIKVIVVNTRLAPEHLLPTAIYDAYDAVRYIALHEKQFAIDKDKICVGGICSGAHCAAVVSNISRSNSHFKIQHQILLNGYYDLTHSCLDFIEQEKEDKMLTREVLSYLYNKCIPSKNEFKNPLYSPYYETNFFNIPATTFIIAEFDGARGDSENYYMKLASLNNKVNKIVLPGQTHNTFLLRKAMSDGIDPAAIFANVINT